MAENFQILNKNNEMETVNKAPKNLNLDEINQMKRSTLKRAEYHDPYIWDFTTVLENNADIIKKEFENLEQSLFHPWPEIDLFKKGDQKGKGWDVFGLFAFGKVHPTNIELCPKTYEIVKNIPGCSTAAFSVLTANSKILPHVGYYGYSEMVLRCHLGIKIPKDCYLLVNSIAKTWEDGKTLVFDDTYLHSAVNNSNVDRVILLLDFSTGIPVDSQPEVRSQSDYLDQITSKFGYVDRNKDQKQED